MLKTKTQKLIRKVVNANSTTPEFISVIVNDDKIIENKSITLNPTFTANNNINRNSSDFLQFGLNLQKTAISDYKRQ